MVALIIALIIIGAILLVAELIIIPGFGISGILGIASMAGSCIFGFYHYGTSIGIMLIIINVVIILLMLLVFLRSKTWKRASLKTNIDARVDSDPRSKGIKAGLKGMSLTRLGPGGQARLGNYNVEVFTRGQLISPCKEIVVTDIDGTKIYVKEAEEDDSASVKAN